jgi:4-hydroxy-tetrahydrodipicolinate synthase
MPGGPPLGHGVYAALITPFDRAGRVDDDGVDALVDFYLERGVHGLVVSSLIGEALALTVDERAALVERVASRVGGRVPVLAGVCERGDEQARQTARRVAELGVAGLVVPPPQVTASSGEQLTRFLDGIWTAAHLSIVLLDYPALTGVTLDVALLARLGRELEGLRGVKLEDAPTPPKIAALRAAVGPRLRIYGASGGRYCLAELASGADGLMTGYAFPEHLVEIHDRIRSGDQAGAAAVHQRCMPLIELEARSGAAIATRKEMLRLRGVIAHAGVRAPTFQLDPSVRATLRDALSAFSPAPAAPVAGRPVASTAQR